MCIFYWRIRHLQKENLQLKQELQIVLKKSKETEARHIQELTTYHHQLQKILSYKEIAKESLNDDKTYLLN